MYATCGSFIFLVGAGERQLVQIHWCIHKFQLLSGNNRLKTWAIFSERGPKYTSSIACLENGWPTVQPKGRVVNRASD